MKYSGIGGQAVIEGIMMMKGEDYAVAVRRPDKEIEVKKDIYQSITKKAKILQLPFVRGVFRFADSMIIGMRSLSYSASFFEDDEDAEPGKFEQLLDRVFGEKLESAIMAAVLVISFILAIGIFMLLPLGIANLFKGVITSDHLMAVLEVNTFFKVIDSCKGTVELVSPEGDRINLKSKLSQYLSMANIFSNGYIKELELVAYEKEDLDRLIKFMYQGE